MSQYTFTTKDGVIWTVGYDPTRARYFAHKKRPGTNEPEDVTGAHPKPPQTAFDLEEFIADQVAIPTDILDQLHLDAPQNAVTAK